MSKSQPKVRHFFFVQRIIYCASVKKKERDLFEGFENYGFRSKVAEDDTFGVVEKKNGSQLPGHRRSGFRFIDSDTLASGVP